MAIYINDELVAGLSEGVPSGGRTGQVLVKRSNDDYDFEWTDQITLDQINQATQAKMDASWGESY